VSLNRRQFIHQMTHAAAATALPLTMAGGVGVCGASEISRQVRTARVDDARRFAAVKEAFEQDYPGFKISAVQVDGADELRSEQGGMRVFWIYRGRGAISLPKGYRTQEGDGQRLPDVYHADRIDPAFAEMLGVLRNGLDSLTPAATPAVEPILGRWNDPSFTGDIAANLWTLEHLPRPWSQDDQVEAVLAELFSVYRQQGYSTKQADSFEQLIEGDQVIACGDESIAVRGRFLCLAIENTDRKTSHVSTARRLRHLLDTAGGCSFDFDPFRKLPLTWYLSEPGERGDGLNFVNSHVVNIPAELSSTHFHPLRSEIGGLPQTEMYLVLDPRAYQLETWGRKASILIFPDLRDLGRYDQYPLAPGDLVYIPPGVGHRGLDVFVNVLTVPGFKPHNEIYIDQDIRDRTGGGAPYNENGLERKNYDRLEDFL
jgi:hypothetical protein